MNWLRKLFGRKMSGDLPDSLTDLGRSDPCWCGSGKNYGSCHRKEDRRRLRELGLSNADLRRNPLI
ncbi:SEC-C metal-binding domain-containing protein [Geoalkalibacter halelectricus]|uniref:SEC-C metal-binding domain-containing protein n=1 Tax=Geoalkalibacter halelectricus TaxID=2847045 RepID=UPI003D1E1C81